MTVYWRHWVGCALALSLGMATPSWAVGTVSGNAFISYTESWIEKDSILNPSNRGAEIPRSLLMTEVRPEIQLAVLDGLDFVIRSRHWGWYQDVSTESPAERQQRVDGQSDLSDAFISWSPTDSAMLTLGLQNYQWGPAEILSPSNIFYHFNDEQRSFFYKEKGRFLTRLNWIPRPDVAVILMYEPTDNRQQNWVAHRKFSPQSALKIEKQFENPSNSMALILGEVEGLSRYVAEHFSWSLFEGYSLYGDFRHQENQTHFRPISSTGSFLEMTDDQSRVGGAGSWSTLGVVGFRFEGRVDFRQELIYNQAGADQEEWTRLRQSITTISPFLADNLAAFSRPGLELRSRSYSYTSLRIPDLGRKGDVSVAARWLASLVESSSALQLNYEHNLSDELVFSAEITSFLGDRKTEFTLLKSGQASLGARYSF